MILGSDSYEVYEITVQNFIKNHDRPIEDP